MIPWQNIKLNGKTKGQVKALCPACSSTRKNKTEKCLSVNIDSGKANCWNCGEVSFRDHKEAKQYDYPPQNWANYTKLSDKVVKWFKERGISQKTLLDCGITEEKHFFHSHGKEINSIVFNYFQEGILLNKKYRSGDKQFSQSKNAKKVFYGIDDLDGHDEAYIVEGEMDKLAMWEIGIKNCISVQNGANEDLSDIFKNSEDILKALKRVYIAVDMDEPGSILEENIIRRFGKYKCERIHFTGKDANETLMQSPLELQKCIDSSTPYPMDGVFTAKDIKDELYDYYDNGLEECIKPKGKEWEEFNRMFSILMGQLTVVTGIPSHGKSQFIENYVINLVNDHKMKASFFSPEHFPMKLHHGVMAEKTIGKPWSAPFEDYASGETIARMSKQELQDYIDWSSDKIYLTYPTQGEKPTWDWLIESFTEQVFRYGIQVFVIDAWNKVLKNDADSLGETNQILSRLCDFAQMHHAHLFLIAHPKKTNPGEDGKYPIPDLYSVKGSGDFRDQTHNGLCIYRHFGEEKYVEVLNLKTKFKHQGDMEKTCTFDFDLANNRYVPRGAIKNRECIFKIEKQTELL